MTEPTNKDNSHISLDQHWKADLYQLGHCMSAGSQAALIQCRFEQKSSQNNLVMRSEFYAIDIQAAKMF